MNWIKQLAAAIQARRDKAAYRAGFLWAMEEYYIAGVGQSMIEAWVNAPSDKTAFNRGVNQALEVIRNAKTGRGIGLIRGALDRSHPASDLRAQTALNLSSRHVRALKLD